VDLLHDARVHALVVHEGLPLGPVQLVLPRRDDDEAAGGRAAHDAVRRLVVVLQHGAVRDLPALEVLGLGSGLRFELGLGL